MACEKVSEFLIATSIGNLLEGDSSYHFEGTLLRNLQQNLCINKGKSYRQRDSRKARQEFIKITSHCPRPFSTERLSDKHGSAVKSKVGALR